MTVDLRALEADDGTLHVAADGELTRRGFFDALATTPDLGARLRTLVAGSGLDAVFWETPPLTTANASWPFECVLVDAPSLARMRPEPEPFAVYFEGSYAEDDVATFWNLGADAVLIAPCPLPRAAPLEAYTHLAAFLRDGPPEQQLALWRAVAQAVEARLSDRPIWVSTSGLGIGWLHVRVDSVPKYYQHAPYREPDA